MLMQTARGEGVDVAVGRSREGSTFSPLMAKLGRAQAYRFHQGDGRTVAEIAAIHRTTERAVYDDLAALKTAMAKGRPGLMADGSYGYGNAAEA